MQSETPATRRDICAGTLLFFATASFTLWQNTRVAVLWDLSYLLDSSYRIALGQVPYRDFPFAHAPLTFLLHAVIIHLFGRVYFPHVACAAIEGGGATLVTWRILIHILQPFANRAWTIATILATPLATLGIYAIYPHPIYDSDCILIVLVAVYVLQRSAEIPFRNALSGIFCVLPLFCKQNIGLPFLAITVLVVAAIAVARLRQGVTARPQLWFFGGALFVLATAALTIHLTTGLHNYLFWTMTFAARRRLPGLALIFNIYGQASLLWTVPAAFAAVILLRTERLRTRSWPRPTALILLAAPFLWTILSVALTSDPGDRADQILSLWPHLLLLASILALYGSIAPHLLSSSKLNALLPIILLATIHGTFLSQQLWGSTYALWPLLMLLIASLLTQVPDLARPLAFTIAATLLLCGSLYAISDERLNYVHVQVERDGPIAHATLPELRGLSTPGPYLGSFEELVRFSRQEIPANDGILILPGEDPFFFATGRIPQFPILLFDPATDPYSPQQTLDQSRTHNIRWLIVTRELQLTEQPQPDLPDVLHTLQQDFILYRTLTNYDVYRRR